MLIVGLLSLPALYVITRRPVLRRLALRNAIRRPRETLLVVLGSLLGTAIMTGSFVVGDTFNASIRRGAREQLGPVDEVVSTDGVGRADALARRVSGLADPNIDGVLPMTTAVASAASTTSPVRAAPNAQLIEVDFDSARSFGGDPGAVGLSGSTPGPDGAVIGTDTANALHARVGATIRVFAFGGERRLHVVRVVPRIGIAGFMTADQATSPNVFVAPGTIATLYQHASARVAPPLSLVLVSNRGSVTGGERLTDEVHRAVVTALGNAGATIVDAKHLVLDKARRAGSSLSRLYSSLGLFAVLAGILLLVNIFFMLAGERRAELGMLRAVGLRRSGLVAAFIAEGWCYAVLSAIAGTFAGLGLGRALMAAAAKLFSSHADSNRIALHFAFQWASVQRGMIVGFVIAMTTVVLTSVWLARFNIIRAIRDIADPELRRPRRRSSYLALSVSAVGLLLTLLGVMRASFIALLVGPVLVLVGLTPTLARNIGRAVANTVIASLVIAWSIAAVPTALALDASIDVMLFVIQGLLLVGAAVFLVSQHQSAIGHLVGRFARRSLRLRLGLAYPLARRFRTAMTLGMFALVVFILVMVSVFASMFQGQVHQFTADASGGFNVIVQSNATNPVHFDTLASDPNVRAIAPLITAPVEVTAAPGLDSARPWLATGYDQRLVAHGPPALADRGSYPSDAAAYDAVASDPTLVIVDKMFLSLRAGPPKETVAIGDHVTIGSATGGGAATLTVAAIMTPDVASNGMLLSDATMRRLFGVGAVPSRAYVDVADPAAFAGTFAGRFLANGGKAQTVRAIVDDQMAQQQQFFLLMRSYLALGLVVGVAGIGVIMVRAVRERRRQVGVLRALGFQAVAVRAAFEIESAFVAVEGVVIGTLLALVCTWSVSLTDAFGTTMIFRVPFTAIALLTSATLLCTFFATAGPARSAARIEPAIALRIAD